MTQQSGVRAARADPLIVDELSDRELEVLSHVAAGSRNREIARELCVSVKTVEFHLSNILGKLGARSRTEAVVRAWQMGRLQLTTEAVPRVLGPLA